MDSVVTDARKRSVRIGDKAILARVREGRREHRHPGHRGRVSGLVARSVNRGAPVARGAPFAFLRFCWPLPQPRRLDVEATTASRPSERANDRRLLLGFQKGAVSYSVRAVLPNGRRSAWSDAAPAATEGPIGAQ